MSLSLHRLHQTLPLRFLAVLMLVVFVAVQSFGLLHDAGYGFAEHKHDGKTCEIHMYCEHAKLANPPAMAVVVPVVLPAEQVADVAPDAPALVFVAHIFARGPPALLQA